MEKIIGTYKIEETRVFEKSYESPKYFTRIQVEPCEVPVFKFNQDACYRVFGRVIADDTPHNIGQIDETVAQPYAYVMINDPNFTPNDLFFVEFPDLKK